MSNPMAMSGFPLSIIMTGGHIIMEDGSGILSWVGHGFPMSHGDGVFITMGDGSGD